SPCDANHGAEACHFKAFVPTDSRDGQAGLVQRDFFAARLTDIETDLDIQSKVDGRAILHRRVEAPLFQGIDCILVQAEAEAAHQVEDIDFAVFPHEGLQHHRAL